jgi:hypothetical protein
MIQLNEIVLVLEPATANPYFPSLVNSPQPAVEELARLVADCLSAELVVFRGRIEDAPHDSILISEFTSATLDEHPAVARRTVLVDVGRTSILDTVESRGVAAAVETIDFVHWSSKRENAGAAIYGRREVAITMDAIRSEVNGVWAGPRYCQFQVKTISSLPTLIAEYLRVYVKECGQ